MQKWTRKASDLTTYFIMLSIVDTMPALFKRHARGAVVVHVSRTHTARMRLYVARRVGEHVRAGLVAQ